jgi:hypothetical protein
MGERLLRQRNFRLFWTRPMDVEGLVTPGLAEACRGDPYEPDVTDTGSVRQEHTVDC